MERAISETKAIIQRQINRNQIHFYGEMFSKYQKGYYWTNENIPGYLDLVSFEGKTSALAVCASGDQTFNLITKGIHTVDTFDSNCLTEYLAFGLKRAMILKYDYDRFMAISSLIRSSKISVEILTDTIKSLIPFMEEKHKIYWNAILDFNYKTQKESGTKLNLILMLFFTCTETKSLNNYLRDEEHYEMLRNRLASANITFRNVDAINLPEEYKSNKYDSIILSNIPDYFYKLWGNGWSYNKLSEFEINLERIVNPGGVIFLEYILGFEYLDGSAPIISESSIVRTDLLDEELHSIPYPYSDIDDGVVLKKVL